MYVRAWVLGHRGARLPLTLSVLLWAGVAFDRMSIASALPTLWSFRCSWARPHAPLPTLRRRPHGRPRTARGETWMVSPSFQRTFTAYLVPVSLAHCPRLFSRSITAPGARDTGATLERCRRTWWARSAGLSLRRAKPGRHRCSKKYQRLGGLRPGPGLGETTGSGLIHWQENRLAFKENSPWRRSPLRWGLPGF